MPSHSIVPCVKPPRRVLAVAPLRFVDLGNQVSFRSLVARRLWIGATDPCPLLGRSRCSPFLLRGYFGILRVSLSITEKEIDVKYLVL